MSIRRRPDSGKNPRPVVKAKVNEPIRINYLLTNVYPHKTLENVVVHFYVARQSKVGQKELPDLKGDVVHGIGIRHGFQARRQGRPANDAQDRYGGRLPDPRRNTEHPERPRAFLGRSTSSSATRPSSRDESDIRPRRVSRGPRQGSRCSESLTRFRRAILTIRREILGVWVPFSAGGLNVSRNRFKTIDRTGRSKGCCYSLRVTMAARRGDPCTDRRSCPRCIVRSSRLAAARAGRGSARRCSA